MLHPGKATSVADRLVQWIGRGCPAEAFAIAPAKTLDALVVEQRFTRGQQQEPLERPGRTLGAGIEGPQRFQFVAEEIEPQALFQTGRIDVEHAAAHRVFAGIDHGIGAGITLALEQRDQAFTPDLQLRCQFAHRFADAERGQRALEHRVDRGDEQLRPFGRGLQAVQRRQPLGAGRQRGAGAIVGQAIPSRVFDRLQFGREEHRRFGDAAHPGFVGRDPHRAPVAFCMCHSPREVGHDQRRRAPGDRSERQRRLGRKDAVEIGHKLGKRASVPP